MTQTNQRQDWEGPLKLLQKQLYEEELCRLQECGSLAVFQDQLETLKEDRGALQSEGSWKFLQSVVKRLSPIVAAVEYVAPSLGIPSCMWGAMILLLDVSYPSAHCV